MNAHRCQHRRHHGSVAMLAALVWAGCEGEVVEPVPVRDPLCALHPPPPSGSGVDLRVSWALYFDAASGRCIDAPSPADMLTAWGCSSEDDCRAKYAPFRSTEECLAVCAEPTACDVDHPCPPYVFPCAAPPCPTFDPVCVWLPAEDRGFCATACESPGVAREHFGWPRDAECADGLACTPVAPDCYPCRVAAEACVLPEP
jgi:hypothetical protein